MHKFILMVALLGMPMMLSACGGKCEVEPIVEENHKLIVPPNFGEMPK